MNNILIDGVAYKYQIDKIAGDEIIVNLPISLGKKLYEGEFLKDFIDKIVSFVKDSKKTIKLIQFDVGDVLNRHNLYYSYLIKYLKENNLNDVSDISLDKIKQIQEKAYIRSKEQGWEWFNRNVNIINNLIPNEFRIEEGFELEENQTILYQGDNNNPKVVYICYEHWLKHKKYKDIENSLKEICKIENNVIERAFKKEAKYFLYRKNRKIESRKLFIEQSYKYLFDEAIACIILNKFQSNIIEFYFGSENYFSQAFKGRKAQNHPIIKKYLQNELRGADQRKFVSVRLDTPKDIKKDSFTSCC